MNSSQTRRNLIARQRGEHCHSYAQVLIGWRGQMDCEFQRDAHRLSKGTVALIPSSVEHLFEGLTDDSELLVVDLSDRDPYIQALEKACQMPFSETLFQRPEFISLSSEIIPMLDFAAGQLQRGKNQTNPLVSCQLVSLFMTQLCQMYSSRQTVPTGNKRLCRTELDNFIDRRLASPPDNAELAQSVNISESHFYHLCQRQFGITPQQYLMQRRMLRAQFLVLNSQMPLMELAAEVGFSDASSFSRAYKHFFHETPGRARRIQQQ
ncbi:AraC family transcriptional regulator [Motiliproteus sp. MSK22-1]|uniref:helix-turn-helix domain-containing protein n=1 Tax=Motiliproteus sp. MSK22-1 TaxID=1897630 RepID=UPI0009787A07|nr:AraC family transcriptional regulator [Motiliproteus sp. MSK22-1]OMH36264.1 AraC family transcriptional regulator [Motiliproteus sp. MSK22-1]